MEIGQGVVCVFPENATGGLLKNSGIYVVEGFHDCTGQRSVSVKGIFAPPEWGLANCSRCGKAFGESAIMYWEENTFVPLDEITKGAEEEIAETLELDTIMVPNLVVGK